MNSEEVEGVDSLWGPTWSGVVLVLLSVIYMLLLTKVVNVVHDRLPLRKSTIHFIIVMLEAVPFTYKVVDLYPWRLLSYSTTLLSIIMLYTLIRGIWVRRQEDWGKPVAK
ncbi:hypothetical protein KCX80_13040 [Paenibacillus mucilaginosus]|nr:hypothetical protein [Paenibacillus mucilaginosus]WDM30010.1 hypothetical protein KCX80_13040 [Paenibacillus mucilaginosus]